MALALAVPVAVAVADRLCDDIIPGLAHDIICDDIIYLGTEQQIISKEIVCHFLIFKVGKFVS